MAEIHEPAGSDEGGRNEPLGLVLPIYETGVDELTFDDLDALRESPVVDASGVRVGPVAGFEFPSTGGDLGLVVDVTDDAESERGTGPGTTTVPWSMVADIDEDGGGIRLGTDVDDVEGEGPVRFVVSTSAPDASPGPGGRGWPATVGTGPVRDRTGTLVIGQWTATPLSPDDEGDGDWDTYQLGFDFTISPLTRKRYTEANLWFELRTRGCTARDLLPGSVGQDIEVEETYGITTELKFELPAKAGASYLLKESYTYRAPVTTGWGNGTGRFGWQFLPQHGTDHISYGSRPLRLLLDVPRGEHLLYGQVNIRFARRERGIFGRIRGGIDPVEFVIDLRDGRGLW